MANATMQKFGFPATLVHQFEHWAVLVRPAQVTLGSLVLVATGEHSAYGDLPPAAFTEQGRAVRAIERALAAFTRFERINYLMLMMVDPHVHFHVIPRYSEARTWRGKPFADAGWPGQPALGSAVTLDAADIDELAQALKPAIGDNLD